MARRKQYKHRSQAPLLQGVPINSPWELLGYMIICAPFLLWYYIKTHPVQGFFIIAGIITFVVWYISYRKKKRAAYLKWFFDRKRRLEEINANEFIDTEITKAIENALKTGKNVAIGNETRSFQDIRDSYNEIWKSEEIFNGSDGLSQSPGLALTGKKGFVAKCDPVIFNYASERDGGYTFYLFPEVVLVYVEGPERSVFIAAYRPEAFELIFADAHCDKSVIVHEKTQNGIRYYDKFKPVKDAQIIKSQWKVVNKDGSRSFKGGLLPEHNPLTFRLLYANLSVKLGNYTASTASFSNNRACKEFSDEMSSYARGGSRRRSLGMRRTSLAIEDDDEMIVGRTPTRTNPGSNTLSGQTSTRTGSDIGLASRRSAPIIDDDEVENDSVFNRTSAKISREEPVVPRKIDNPTPGIKEEKKVVPVQQAKPETPSTKTNNSLTEDQARSRNRDAAKVAADALNKKYSSKYDFKVYQVRKPRANWELQDAGVYTYVNDSAGNQYTIEFDLHTKLDIPQTDLSFSIWSKSKELVASRYKTSVSKGMAVNGDGYTLVIKRDYEKMSSATMAATFEKDCLTLMKLIDIDDRP